MREDGALADAFLGKLVGKIYHAWSCVVIEGVNICGLTPHAVVFLVESISSLNSFVNVYLGVYTGSVSYM